jgi:hypothetical protein
MYSSPSVLVDGLGFSTRPESQTMTVPYAGLMNVESSIGSIHHPQVIV